MQKALYAKSNLKKCKSKDNNNIIFNSTPLSLVYVFHLFIPFIQVSRKRNKSIPDLIIGCQTRVYKNTLFLF